MGLTQNRPYFVMAIIRQHMGWADLKVDGLNSELNDSIEANIVANEIRLTGCLATILVLLVTSCGPKPAQVLKKEEVGKGLFVATIDEGSDPLSFEALAMQSCLGIDNCMIGFWVAGEEPSSLPFSEEEILAQRFAFAINVKTGFRRAAWDCNHYPEYPPEKCIPRIRKTTTAP